MRMWRWGTMACLGMLLLPATARAEAEKAAAIIQSAREAAAEWKDYTCVVKIEAVTDTETSVQFGKLRWLAPGFVRSEMTINAPEGETRTLMVTDGKETYTETTGPEGVPAVFHYKVRKGTEGQSAGTEARTPMEMFDQLGAMFDWSVDPDNHGGLIQDMAMDVLIGKYRPGAAAEHIKAEPGKENDRATQRRLGIRRGLIENMIGSMRVWIGRQDKFIHRIELIPPEPKTGAAPGVFGSARAPRIVTTYLDVKFDQNQTPADFVYTVPAGAYVSELPE